MTSALQEKMEQSLQDLKTRIQKLTEPEPLIKNRLRALEKFSNAEPPHPTHESWRRVQLGDLDPLAFEPLAADSELTIQEQPDAGLAILDFPQASTAPDFCKWVGPDFKTLFEEHGDDYFTMLNLASFTQSRLIHVKQELSAPVHLVHTPGQKNALTHHVRVRVETGASLTLIEEFRGRPGDDFTFWNTHTAVSCAPNARFNYIALRNYTDNERFFHNFTARQSRDSRVHVSVVQTGGFAGKSFVTAQLLEPGAEFRGIGLGLGKKRELHDMEMVADHRASHTTSSLLYRTVLRDRAHSVFNGNLIVPKGLKDVSSHQTNNNILLNKKARAESQPRLLVKTEQVQCEHGSTVGEPDKSALFFLMCRGIPEKEARELLVEGFMNQIIDEIPLESKHEDILQMVQTK